MEGFGFPGVGFEGKGSRPSFGLDTSHTIPETRGIQNVHLPWALDKVFKQYLFGRFGISEYMFTRVKLIRTLEPIYL